MIFITEINITCFEAIQFVVICHSFNQDLTRLSFKIVIESVLMRWMKLEPIIQSEVSQKEKHQYSILKRILEFRKMVTITLYVRQQNRHRCIEQSFELCGRGRWDDLGE